MKENLINIDAKIAEMKNIPTSTELYKLLCKGVCDVTFKKQSGEIRKMKCTLKSSLIDPERLPKNKAEDANQSTNVDAPRASFSVFDLEKNHWRSFKYTRIEPNGVYVEDI